MSNYSTSYNISQGGNLYTLQSHGVKTGLAQYTSTRGTTVNAPVNYRKLQVFKGLDNEFFFFIKNQDRKPIQLQNIDIIATLVNRQHGGVIVSRKCHITDYDLGSATLVINASDITNIDNGLYDLILSYKNNQGLNVPLYTDLNMRPNFSVEVSDAAGSIPLDSNILTDFYTIDDYSYSSVVYGPAYWGKRNGMITLAVYVTGYTGKFYLQGSTSESPSSDDWFDIELGVQNFYYAFANTTGIEPFSFRSNIKFLRAKFDANTQGTVDKVVLRV